MTTQTVAAVLAALALAPAVAAAKPVVRNLGGGLQQIAAPEGRARTLSADAKGPKAVAGQARGIELSYPVVFDKSARPLVRITLDGKLPAAAVLQVGQGHRRRRGEGLRLRATAPASSRPTCLPHSLAAIATRRGVLAVVPLEPDVHQRRARAQTGASSCTASISVPAGINGRGITIGVMSDSYDTSGSVTGPRPTTS